jgi:hypothetical protein
VAALVSLDAGVSFSRVGMTAATLLQQNRLQPSFAILNNYPWVRGALIPPRGD